jgi:carbon storage regulator
MLVLSRKVGERVVIAGQIVVGILGVSGRQIRLGIEAPPEVTILRAELAVKKASPAGRRQTVRKSW